ncbi:hypothetical protein IAT38_002591 [Cryptococcus sp. DSM 104549]
MTAPLRALSRHLSQHATRITPFSPHNRLPPLQLPTSRYLSTSVALMKLSKKGKAAHPTKHEERAVSSGEAVAELVEENKSTTSGHTSQSENIASTATGPDPTAPLASTPTHSLFSLSNRTIIVTGGGRGLGLTVALSLLESGAHVVCLDILPEPSGDQWKQAEGIAREKGTTIRYLGVDVTDQEGVGRVMSEIFEGAPEEAPVRGLFTSAGIQIMLPATSYPLDKFRKVLDVNLLGTFLCAQAFAIEWFKAHPHSDGGSGEGAAIVMTGSMSGHIANLGLNCAAYNASKAGVNQLAKNLAMEWSRKGIRVNSLSPGYIRTALTAALLDEKPELQELWLRGSLLGRLSTPDEFRGPVVFLLSDASSYMTGADLLVDGGHCAT